MWKAASPVARVDLASGRQQIRDFKGLRHIFALLRGRKRVEPLKDLGKRTSSASVWLLTADYYTGQASNPTSFEARKS